MKKQKVINYEKEYRKIYQILVGLKDISEAQLDRLVLVYGEDFVILVLKYISRENEEILDKILRISPKLYSYIEGEKKFSVYGDGINNDVLDNDVNKKDELVIKDDVSSNLSDDNKVDSSVVMDDNCVLELFGAYIKDMSIIKDISDEEKEILIDKVINIISELNELLVLAGSDNLELPNGKKPWIVDKLNYCLENCEDKELLKKINGLYTDFIDIRERIMNGYLKFVISIAKEYYKCGSIPIVDLVQFGNVGLMSAIEKYNYDYGIKFSTYAHQWISNYIMTYSKDIMYEIRKPSHMFGYNNKRIRVINELSQKFNRKPTDEEVAEYMDMPVEKILLIERSFKDTVSLDEEVELLYDGFCMSLKQAIVDENVDVEAEVIDKCFSEELNDILLKYLSERELRILKYVYVDEMSFCEIASILGITNQRVGQLHKRMINKLSKKRSLRKLTGYID